jgi:hypothetical protein
MNELNIIFLILALVGTALLLYILFSAENILQKK